jgi:hypothetical protein
MRLPAPRLRTTTQFEAEEMGSDCGPSSRRTEGADRGTNPRADRNHHRSNNGTNQAITLRNEQLDIASNRAESN